MSTEVTYQDLTPDRLLDAVESVGYRCDGRLLALNSFENRVYQIGIDESEPVVAKFYRIGRWSDEAIIEDHAFTLELAEREIPVVAPLVDANGNTLHQFEGFRFALYPRRPGRAPELDHPDTLKWMGRFIARIHAVGAISPFVHRPALDIGSYGDEPLRFLLKNQFIPMDLEPAYRSVVEDILQRVRAAYARAGKIENIRLHCDCHPGNILWTDAGPHFVDFDDSRMGPAIQDIWMLLSGDRASQNAQLLHVMEGYKEFCDFNPAELHLLEALRTLRMIHYSGWLAKRWEDPAFPVAFPWFNTQHYWQDQILGLREQAALLDEPPLVLKSHY
ncbi:serine/threonine protein kinase [Sulfurirhabdus autotrophica]|uniref:Stress response kinase A n=1 Tax=Sulfurirhabdus autotrophica TaxID=1706046 RepID=A0A4R3Y2F7_9PROT|nr:serine/threonine protein kinase [Sulfurirhabdus autotrophica]TCV86335.1 Ser/Thr protein kinase RdoA (MazF antagonist) [Sulfurirhabdus autotrophica]